MDELILTQRDELLSALEVFVGSNDVTEMESMAKVIACFPDNPDLAASVNALRVLIKVKNEIADMEAA